MRNHLHTLVCQESNGLRTKHQVIRDHFIKIDLLKNIKFQKMKLDNGYYIYHV